MPLPIPDIMENASNVLVEAKKIVNLFGDKPEFQELKAALKKVNKDDLLAVLNEVGTVYRGAHNPQIPSIGSRPNMNTKMLEVLINIDFGLGPRGTIVALPADSAREFVQNINNNFTALQIDALAQPGATEGGLILKNG